MPYYNWSPCKLGVDLATLTDLQRKITDVDLRSRSVWTLSEVQGALVSGALKLKISPVAQTEMFQTLNWLASDLQNFICCVYSGRYDGSQWCYAQGTKIDIACDAYVMGFDRINNKENQQTTEAYVKFAVVGVLVYVVSAHAVKPKKERF